MSHDGQMFHLLVNELEQVADEMEGKRVDRTDMFLALCALSRLSLAWDDELATAALDVAACKFGGFYEVLLELPDCMSNLKDELEKALPSA